MECTHPSKPQYYSVFTTQCNLLYTNVYSLSYLLSLTKLSKKSNSKVAVVHLRQYKCKQTNVKHSMSNYELKLCTKCLHLSQNGGHAGCISCYSYIQYFVIVLVFIIVLPAWGCVRQKWCHRACAKAQQGIWEPGGMCLNFCNSAYTVVFIQTGHQWRLKQPQRERESLKDSYSHVVKDGKPRGFVYIFFI